MRSRFLLITLAVLAGTASAQMSVPIQNLPAASVPIGPNDLTVVGQNGGLHKATVTQLFAGTPLDAGSVTSGLLPAARLSGVDLSATASIATSATALLTNAARFNQIISILDYGALPGTQTTCTVTTTSSSTTLNVSGCTFAPTSAICHSGPGCTGTTDNLITIDGAGPLLTTSSVASVAVTAAGSLYATIPTITVSGGSGSGFLGQVNMGLSAAAVVSGGSGCTPGSQTFTVSGGTQTTPAQLTGTVTGGGALSGSLTPTIAGSYQVLPSTSAASVTGGGCSVAPTISNTWNAQSITTIFGGQNYPSGTTASLSGGTATVGTPVLRTPSAATYYGTVVGFTNSGQVTLNAAPGQTLAGISEMLSWGTDNAAAIVAADNAAAVVAGGFGRIYVPAGYWLTSGPMTLNPGGRPTMIYGAGPDKSVIVAGAAMSSLLFEPTSFTWGGEVANLTFDGNRLATNAAYLSCAQRNLIHSVNFNNAAPFGANIVLGDGITAGCNTSSLIDVLARNSITRYVGHNDLPLQNAIINQTDSTWTNFIAQAASQSHVLIASTAFNTHMIAPHVFGAPANDYGATTGYQVNAWSMLSQVNIDRNQQIGTDINAEGVHFDVGSYQQPEVASLAVGVQIEPSTNDVTVTSFNGVNITTASNRVVLGSPIGSNVFTYANPLANDYNPLPRLPFGDTSSLSLGTNALFSATSTLNTTAIGTNCLFNELTPQAVTCLGRSAGFNATGTNGTFLGAFAGFNISSGIGNTVAGFGSLESGASRITGSHIAAYGENVGLLVAGSSGIFSMYGANVGSVTCRTVNSVLLVGFSNAVDCPASTTSNWANVGNAYLASLVPPTISSGFGSGASVTAGTTSKAFTIGVGTGGTASTGVIAFATAAPTGWICKVTDVSNVASFITESVTTSSTSVTLTNFSRTTGAQVAWTASDFLTGACDGY